MTVENIIFDVAEALRYPVLVLALLALVVVLFEVGRLFVESRRRRRRGMPRLEQALDIAREALSAGDGEKALRAVRGLGFNRTMSEALGSIVEQGGYPDAEDRISKRMAEYDYRSMKRLERTRILVRAGPALGLMGTLIPLSPALASLAEGDVTGLTRDLRVAFSVTVAGLLIGMVAFAVSLVRDRFYAQDFSDVEYVRAALAGKVPPPPSPADAAKQPEAAKPDAVTAVTTPSSASQVAAAAPTPPHGDRVVPPAAPTPPLGDRVAPAPPSSSPPHGDQFAPASPPPSPSEQSVPPTASSTDGLEAKPEGTETREGP